MSSRVRDSNGRSPFHVRRIAIISDTHWRRPAQFRDQLLELLQGAELILHAGDVEGAFVLERLEQVAPVMAVRGNCDGSHLGLPVCRVLDLDGFEVGLFHGYDVDLRSAQEVSAYFGDAVPLVVHGHTHVPRVERYQETTVFCPGSPYQPRQSSPGAIGWLELDQGQLSRLYHQRV